MGFLREDAGPPSWLIRASPITTICCCATRFCASGPPSPCCCTTLLYTRRHAAGAAHPGLPGRSAHDFRARRLLTTTTAAGGAAAARGMLRWRMQQANQHGPMQSHPWRQRCQLCLMQPRSGAGRGCAGGSYMPPARPACQGSERKWGRGHSGGWAGGGAAAGGGQ